MTRPKLAPNANRTEQVTFLRRWASMKARQALVNSGQYTEAELLALCPDCEAHPIQLLTTRKPMTDETERLVRCVVCGMARIVKGPTVHRKTDNVGRSYWPMYWSKDETKERIVPEAELLQRAIDSGELSEQVVEELEKRIETLTKGKGI